MLIDGKSFFDVPVKNKEEAYEKIMSIGKNNDYTTGNLFPDLRQQINFIGKLEDDKATMFFIIEKSEETTFEFLQNSVSII